MRVGLTGGVGAGKSTVAALLAGHGALVVDADAIARDVVRAGTSGFRAVVARFGPGVVRPDGELDRAAIAELVFGDENARADLNAIVHPLVGEESARRAAAAPDRAIIVHDIPLLVENRLADGFDVVVVVEADDRVRLHRLAARGLPAEQARARMAAQASDAQRRPVADEILRNDGSADQLGRDVDALWVRLQERAAGVKGSAAIG